MGNFDDFDLDLKKVAESGTPRDWVDSFGSLTSVTGVICSVAGELTHHVCGKPSADIPTTGMSTNCCRGGGGNATPKCI